MSAIKSHPTLVPSDRVSEKASWIDWQGKSNFFPDLLLTYPERWSKGNTARADINFSGQSLSRHDRIRCRVCSMPAAVRCQPVPTGSNFDLNLQNAQIKMFACQISIGCHWLSPPPWIPREDNLDSCRLRDVASGCLHSRGYLLRGTTDV